MYKMIFASIETYKNVTRGNTWILNHNNMENLLRDIAYRTSYGHFAANLPDAPSWMLNVLVEPYFSNVKNIGFSTLRT